MDDGINNTIREEGQGLPQIVAWLVVVVPSGPHGVLVCVDGS